MSIYALVAVGGTGLGPLAAGWIEMNPHLQWRWIQWIHMMLVWVAYASFYLSLMLMMQSYQSHRSCAHSGCHIHG